MRWPNPFQHVNKYKPTSWTTNRKDDVRYSYVLSRRLFLNISKQADPYCHCHTIGILMTRCWSSMMLGRTLGKEILRKPSSCGKEKRETAFTRMQNFFSRQMLSTNNTVKLTLWGMLFRLNLRVLVRALRGCGWRTGTLTLCLTRMPMNPCGVLRWAYKNLAEELSTHKKPEARWMRSSNKPLPNATTLCHRHRKLSTNTSSEQQQPSPSSNCQQPFRGSGNPGSTQGRHEGGSFCPHKLLIQRSIPRLRWSQSANKPIQHDAMANLS